MELHQGFRRSYGARRLHQALRQKGYICSVRRVNRLMKELGVKSTTTGLYRWSAGRQEFYSSTENRLAKMDAPAKPGKQWAGDFTYLNLGNSYLFYAVVLDLCTRRVVGWSFSRTRNAELTKGALKMALDQHPPKKDCVFHSDQGIEYAAHEFRDLVEKSQMVRSMSRKATPIDNAIVESFFHSLKTEVVHQGSSKNEYQVVAKIVQYIDYYNYERLHSSLDYQSPVEYEKLCA